MLRTPQTGKIESNRVHLYTGLDDLLAVRTPAIEDGCFRRRMGKVQHCVRQLRRMASKYDVDARWLSDGEKLEFLAVKSPLFILSRELNLIFESLARAQARQTDMEGNDVFALRDTLRERFTVPSV
jgi:hypothetical protein